MPTAIVSRKQGQKDPSHEVLRAFRLFDEENKGVITARNLGKIAAEFGENLSEDELQAMIDEFDRDGDGKST